MDQQCHYVGLDVSLETTSICVIDDASKVAPTELRPWRRRLTTIART